MVRFLCKKVLRARSCVNLPTRHVRAESSGQAFCGHLLLCGVLAYVGAFNFARYMVVMKQMMNEDGPAVETPKLADDRLSQTFALVTSVEDVRQRCVE